MKATEQGKLVSIAECARRLRRNRVMLRDFAIANGLAVAWGKRLLVNCDRLAKAIESNTYRPTFKPWRRRTQPAMVDPKYVDVRC